MKQAFCVKRFIIFRTFKMNSSEPTNVELNRPKYTLSAKIINYKTCTC